MWSVGALLELDERQKMQAFLFAHESKFKYPTMRHEKDSIFDYGVNENGLRFKFLFSYKFYINFILFLFFDALFLMKIECRKIPACSSINQETSLYI